MPDSTDTTPAPRLATGRRLHRVEGDAYWVLLDPTGKEVSERIVGTLYWGITGPSETKFFLVPHSTDADSSITLHATGRFDRAALCLEDDGILATISIWGHAKDTATIDWLGSLDLMA